MRPVARDEDATLKGLERGTTWHDRSKMTGSAALRAPVLASVETTSGLLGEGNLTDLALPALGTVGGMFVMEGANAMIELSLPALTSVETLRIVDNDALTSVDAPLLATAVSLEALGNAKLATIHLGAVTTLQSLTLYEHASLDYFAPPLTSVGELQLSNGTFAPPLGCHSHSIQITHRPYSEYTSARVQGIVTAGSVAVVGAVVGSRLQSVRFDDLESAETVGIIDNDALLELAFPAPKTITTRLALYGNANLSTVDAPVLAKVGEMQAASNVSWSQCDLEAWAASLGVVCTCDSNGACAR
jgi:hypothetical protein